MFPKAALLIPLLTVCPMLEANVIVSSSLSLTSLQIMPQTGSLQIQIGTGASAFAQALDSLGGFDQDGNSATDAPTSANAVTTTANASAAASAPALTTGATGGVNLLGIDASADTSANGQLVGTLEVTDTTGMANPVSALFSAALNGDQSLMTDFFGVSAFSEVIFQLSLPDVGLVPFLFYDAPLNIGPSQTLINPINQTVSDSTTLMTNTPYTLFVEVDAEASGVNGAAPEPSSIVLAAVGLVIVALSRLRRRTAVVCFLFLVALVATTQAKNIGADPPARCGTCSCSCKGGPTVAQPSNTSSNLSRTEGNVTETVPIGSVHSTWGTTLQMTATYNSYNADSSRATVDTVMGYGWTHSYNILLFSQFGAMFRYDGDGRVTKFGIGPGGAYITSTGYFETLVKSGASFILTRKDKTTYTFVSVPGTPFLVGGPVWRLTSIVDRNGNTTTLAYTSGNLTSVTDTYGRAITYTYDIHNKISTITDPAGRTTTFTYDATGHKLTQIADPNGKTIQYSYNTLYQLTNKTDKDGRIFTYTYSANEPVSVNDGAGGSPGTMANSGNWATDPTQLASQVMRVYIPATTNVTDGRGHVWQYQYDSHGYLTQTTAPDGATTRYTYDPETLQLASITDPDGNTTSYQYDTQGNRTQTMDALGHVTTYTYEPTYNMMTSMTDPRGRVTTYTIDPATGNMTKETDPLGQTRSWSYDANGNILTQTDKDGHTTTNTYDSFGNQIQVTDPVGNVTHMAYDAVGNMTSMTDARGNTTTYQYDGLNRQIKVTDPTGHSDQTIYDGEGNHTQTIDRNGHSTSYQYDLRRRLTQTIDALGHAETYAYDGADNRISLTDRDGHTVVFGYDLENRQTTITDALGNVTTTVYDGAGNVISTTDGNSHTTSYGYDPLNRRTSMIDAAGDRTQYFYDTGTFSGPVRGMSCNQCGATPGSSRVTEQIDPDGSAGSHAGVTYYKYDALDRLVIGVSKVNCIGAGCSDSITGTSCPEIVGANDAVTSYTHDPAGNRLSITEPDCNTTMLAYDADNRIVTETNAAGDVTSTTYDPVGNVRTTTAPNLNAITNTYDSLNRMIQVTDSIGLAGTYGYDPAGNRISQGDGNGNLTTYGYDALNRVTTMTDPLSRATQYQYDAVGNMLQSTDRNSNTTMYGYDAINRRTSVRDALGNTTQYQYDHVGNLTRLTDAGGHSTQYFYDAVNRPQQETYADGLSRSYAYDSSGNLVRRTDQIGQITNYSYNDLYFITNRTYPSAINDSFTYDLSGRMLSAQRGSWPLTYTYDGANRVIQSMQNGHTISYSYNITGRTRTLMYPGGKTITEHTDARARLDHIDDGGSPSIAQYTYDPGNRTLSRTYRNGAAATYTYNNDDWLTNLQHSHVATPIAGFSYAYDNEGNKQYENKLQDSTHSEAYQYDSTYRLINYQVGTLVGSVAPAPSTQTAYSLDPVGNWNSKTTNSVTQTRSHNSTNELVQINSTTVTYDSDGNMINDGTYSYVYDEENRLTRATRNSDSAVVGQYQYDALSRRVQKIADPAGTSTTTQYFYDLGRVIEEQNGLGATQATYTYGGYVDEALTMDRAGQTYYYHQNALWSVEAITDGTGTPVERYSYDAYGAPAVTDGAFNPIAPNAWGTPHSAIGNPWMFTGRQLDEEGGLYYYRARYYDAAKGRFIERDPEEVHGFAATSANLYAYVLDSPMNFLDPSGDVEVGKNEYGSFDLTQKNINDKRWKDGKLEADPGRYMSDVTIRFSPNKDKVCCSEIAFVQSARTIDATTLMPAPMSDEHQARMVQPKPNPQTSADTGGFIIDAPRGGTFGYIGYTDADTRRANVVTPGSSPIPLVDARMRDAPGWKRANTRFEFETCAVCKSGWEYGKVYACLNWGFMADKDKKMTSYNPIFHNEPASWWKAAVSRWNAQPKLTPLEIEGID